MKQLSFFHPKSLANQIPLLCFIFLMLIGFDAQSTSITWQGNNETSGSSWHVASNWSTNALPSSADDVIIPNVSNMPLITTAAVCNSITIDANSSLTIGNGGSLAVYGNWSNSGTFNAGTSTVTLKGNGVTQTFTGNTTFYNLTLANTSSTTNFGTSTITIAGTLSKTNGTMVPGTSTLKFTGAACSIEGSDAKTFFNLEIATGASVTNSGENITIKGNFTNNGTFNQGSGIKTFFAGSGTHSLSGNGTTTFGILDINTSNIVNAGSHNITISGTSFPVTGTFNGGTATVTLSGATSIAGSGTYNFNNLVLSGTGNKTIAAGKSVTVNGTLTTGDKLVVESDASLIAKGTSTGNVTYNRSLSPTRWYIVSAPVQATGFDSNAGRLYSSTDFATYSESSNEWNYGAIQSTLEAGKGYLLSINTSNTSIAFNGALNNGDVTKGVTSSAGNGWNAVGNPYTSAIGIRSTAASTENFLTKNTGIFKDGYAAIYVWNETGTYGENDQYYKAIGNSGYTPPSEYETLNENYIQAGQGFMINAKAAGNVVFTKDMQVHQTGISLKDAEISWPGITLMAETKGQKRSTAIGFNENMTAGLDVTYDAGLLPTDPFQVYTHLVSGDSPIDFTIQCLPDQFSGLRIPVGIDLPDGGEVVFKTSGVILPTGYFPVLEDRLLKTNTPLKAETDSYKVTLDKNTKGIGRFYLSVAQTVLASNNLFKEKNYSVFLSDGNIHIAGQVNDVSAKAILFDISGRKLAEYPLHSQNRNAIDLRGWTAQVFFLMIEGKNYRQVEKISVFN